MGEKCPTCGQAVAPQPLGTEPNKLLEAMAEHGPNATHQVRRNIYKTAVGGWALTHGHHFHEPKFWSGHVVTDLANQGLIVPTYDGFYECFSLPFQDKSS